MEFKIVLFLIHKNRVVRLWVTEGDEYVWECGLPALPFFRKLVEGGITFCHAHVTFYFGLSLMREEGNLAVKSSLSPPCVFFVPLLLSFCCSLACRGGRAPANPSRSIVELFPWALLPVSCCTPDFCLLQWFTHVSP